MQHHYCVNEIYETFMLGCVFFAGVKFAVIKKQNKTKNTGLGVYIWFCLAMLVCFKCTAPHLLQGSVGVGAHAVQFVDECEKGDVVAFHLPVHCHGLTLNSSHRAQHQHGAVQHSQCSLHLDGKVHVAWRLEEDIDVSRKINTLVFVCWIWIGPASWRSCWCMSKCDFQ